MSEHKLSYIVINEDRKAIRRFTTRYRVEETMKLGVQWICIDRSAPSQVEDRAALEEHLNTLETEEEKEKFLQWIEKQEESDRTYAEAVEAMKEMGVAHIKADGEEPIAHCCEMGMELVDGEFVCLTNQYADYEHDAEENMLRVMEKFPEEDIFTFRFMPFGKYKNMKPGARDTAKLEILNETKEQHLFPPAALIRTSVARKIAFQTGCEADTTFIFLVRACLEKGRVVVMDRVYCRYVKNLSRVTDKHYGINDKDYYIPAMEKLWLPLVQEQAAKGPLPKWLQIAVFYQLYFRYFGNLNVRNKFLMTSDEEPVFFDLTTEILQHIEDEYINDNLNHLEYQPPFSVRVMLTYMKHHGKVEELDRRFFLEDGKLFFSTCGVRYDLSKHQDIKIMAFNKRDGKLCVDARYFTDMLYQYEPGSVVCKVGDREIPLTHTDYYALDKIFGVAVEKSYTFYFEIPMEELTKQETKITFWLRLDGKEQSMPIFFNRAPGKLNNSTSAAYWMLDESHFICYEDSAIVCRYADKKALAKRESEYRKQGVRYIFNTKDGIKRKMKDTYMFLKLRRNALKLKPKYKDRRVWIYFDKLFKAGDNGEYAFRYAYYNDPSIESYYVINKNAPDTERLVAEFGDRILIYGSYRCRLMALLAENIMATHPDIIEFLGFGKKMTNLMKDMFNPRLVCIAHGVTIQKNADYQNRLFDNTMFYTTSSKYEVAHITQPVYGYHQDEVALTGMARFDGLKNNDQKQILITPTWRRNLVGGAKRNSTRAYASAFKETDYYKIYNALINDERIIETAKKTGYRVIFLLHPSMSTQIDDYDRNDFVELIPASGDMSYEKILTESSLMITDYSGIHYDFGYQRKPVVYYQPKEVPMRFEEGAMKFATMGFGPVCTEYEDAVRLICGYMENQCVMEPEYRKRADDFFAFDDFNSSERIHKAVLDWIERTGGHKAARS